MAGRFISIDRQSFWLPDPDDVSQLASAFGAIENNLDETQQQLQALRSPESWANWSGRAAGAFASQLSTVPGQISQAHEAYATVTAALSTYSAGLYPVRSAILSLVTEDEEAETTLQNETAELNHARQTGDHASVTYWTSRVQVATENVNSLGARLANLHGELTDLAGACARKINQAQHDGMQSSVLGDIGHDLADVGAAFHAGGSLALKDLDLDSHLFDETFVQPFTNFPSLVADLWNDPDLHTAGKLIEDFADAVGVIALVALVVAISIGTGGVADWLFGAADMLGGVVMGAHIDALGANTAAVLTHEDDSSWIDVSKSALDVASDGAGSRITDDAANAAFSIDGGEAITGFDDLLDHQFGAPAVTSETPDVVSGLRAVSGAVQGLQGLPVSTASPESASVLQPAVGVSSSAAVSIQHVSISQEVGIQ